MSGALALAASIAAMDERTLGTLAQRRRVLAPEQVHDPLGLALELLRPDSITRALQGLNRTQLDTLLRLAHAAEFDLAPDTDATLRTLGLVGVDDARTVPLAEVSEAVTAAFPTGLSTHEMADHRHATPTPNGAATPDTSGWFAPAIAAVRRTAAMLTVLADRPAALSRSGAATVIAVRELAAAAVTGDATGSGLLLAVAQSAGLTQAVTVRGRRGDISVLYPSDAATVWAAQPLHQRWVELAAAALTPTDPPALAVSPLRAAIDLADGDARLAVTEVLPAEYPLLPEADLVAAHVFADTAEELGATVAGVLTPAARAILAGDLATAATLAEREFPDPVPGVYVQPDLSVVVPGPLAPDDEQAIAALADAEQLGVAATLRLSEASLRRALQAGVSTRVMRDTLERLSLTGIPQPLDYLLSDLDRTRAAAGGHDRERHATARASTLSSNNARAHAGHIHAGDTAIPDVTGSHGRGEASSTAGEAGTVGTAGADDALSAMVARVHAAAQASPGTGELSRMLELAIRDRTPVKVTAAAGGEQRSFVVLPVAISGGRLRATDEQAGVQRTLPLSAIVAVEAA